MNEIKMNALKADLAIMDKLDIKPNYSALARKYGLDYRTVKKYHEGYTGKPVRRNKTSILDDYKSKIQEKMKIKRINHKAIYRMLLNEYGADKIGSYSNYKAYCKKNNLVIKANPKGNPIFETEPGDLAEVDWKENITLHNRSGEEFTINIFHIVLKFSRYSYIELTLSKEQNILFRVLINSFRFFHGIPKRLLFDNMSTVVNVSGNKKKVNGRMVQFAKDFMFEIQLCKTRSPETKGTNEARNKILDTIRAYDYEFDSYCS